MSQASKSVGASKLAQYAADPISVIKPKPMNKAALRYGNRAHASIGKGPSLPIFVVIGLVAVWLLWKFGVIQL